MPGSALPLLHFAVLGQRDALPGIASARQNNALPSLNTASPRPRLARQYHAFALLGNTLPTSLYSTTLCSAKAEQNGAEQRRRIAGPG